MMTLDHHMFFLYTITIIIVDLSQVTFIYIVLFTIHIVSKQLYRDNRKIMQKKSIVATWPC